VSWLSNLLHPLRRRERRAAAAGFARGFKAAARNRLLDDWTIAPLSTNEELRKSLETLARRSRDLARSNSLQIKFLNMCVRNIVLSGMKLQVQGRDPGGNLDSLGNAAVEYGWADWGARQPDGRALCDAAAKLDFPQLHRSLVRMKARDGEYFVRLVRQPAGNRYGLALQVIPPECVDYTYSEQLSNGNRVIMGIELDAMNRPVNYHVLRDNPGDLMRRSRTYAARDRLVIPAADIIHSFEAIFEDQVRGIPWAYGGMLDMHIYSGYTEAELVAAREAACVSAFYEVPQDDDPTKFSAAPAKELEPGTAEVGLPGWKKTLLDPKHPGANFSPFTHEVKRDMASGLDVAYSTFANDLTDVNFSSIRAGLLDERDAWIVRQENEKSDFVSRVYLAWLASALLNSAITVAGRPIPVTRHAKFAPHKIRARRWPWVDPLKDAEFNAILVDRGWRTNEDVCADLGSGEFEDNVEAIAAERKLAKAAGLPDPAATPSSTEPTP
jgi:lambda family phage portal protein